MKRGSLLQRETESGTGETIKNTRYKVEFDLLRLAFLAARLRKYGRPQLPL